MEGWIEAEVPNADTRYMGKGYTTAVREFYESGKACVKRDFGDNAKGAYHSLLSGVSNTKLPVRAMKRGSIIYLIREQ